MGLQDEVFYLGERSDSSVLGVWCEPDVEAILLNSAYGFGIGFAPYEAVEPWFKALLYWCAISFFLVPWSEQELHDAYRALLEELQRRFPYESFPPILEEDEAVATVLEMARRYAESLRGIEESALTASFAKEMSSETYQLRHVAHLIDDALLPGIEPGRSFDRKRFRILLEKCDAPTNDEKGRALEDLAGFLFDSLTDWVLAGRRIHADDCEIDLCYVNASLSQRDWDLGCLLLIECKNRKSPAGIPVLRNLSFVMDAKGARSGVIISMSGFTKVLREQVSRLAAQGKAIILLDGNDLEEIENGLSPEDCIFSKYNALMGSIEDDFAQLC